MTTDIDMPTAQGAVLRKERESQSKSLRIVSKNAYIALGYLSEVERGMKNPSPEILRNICIALGVSMPQLLRSTANHMEKIEEKTCTNATCARNK
jgi:transcriptional regulator with XRE-family HTH domain